MTVDAVSDLDLSYTPPLGSPWDTVQMAAQTWIRATTRALETAIRIPAGEKVWRNTVYMPNLIRVETGASHDEERNGEAKPMPADLSDGIIRLVEEVDAALTTDRWAILNTGTDRAKWLLYDGAALRHCCRLLYEMETAAQSGQEFAIRLLNRAHLEAWLTGLYIHYGGYEAVVRVAQDTRHHLESAHNEAAEFDKWLAAEKKSTRRRVRRVEEVNKDKQQWNEANRNCLRKPWPLLLMFLNCVPSIST